MTMSFKWQDKHMELFLQTYKQYECLWNNKSSNYSKSNAREKAYSLMLSDLNIPGLTIPDIKAKIKTIRTRYGAELAKIRNSERNRAAGDEIYEPRLFWFKDADEFLRKVCTSKPSIGYLISREQEVKEREISFVKDEDNCSTSPENSRNSPIASFSNTCANLQYPKNIWKRSLPNNAPTIKSPIKKFKQMSDEDDKQAPNEFDFFCESLAIQLKKMPLARAIICQEKLQSVMTQERLFQLSEPHPSSVPISSAYHDQNSLSIGGTQNSDHYSLISSTGPRIASVIEADTHHCQPDEGDIKSENISEIETEI